MSSGPVDPEIYKKAIAEIDLIKKGINSQSITYAQAIALFNKNVGNFLRDSLKYRNKKFFIPKKIFYDQIDRKSSGDSTVSLSTYTKLMRSYLKEQEKIVDVNVSLDKKETKTLAAESKKEFEDIETMKQIAQSEFLRKESDLKDLKNQIEKYEKIKNDIIQKYDSELSNIPDEGFRFQFEQFMEDELKKITIDESKYSAMNLTQLDTEDTGLSAMIETELGNRYIKKFKKNNKIPDSEDKLFTKIITKYSDFIASRILDPYINNQFLVEEKSIDLPTEKPEVPITEELKSLAPEIKQIEEEEKLPISRSIQVSEQQPIEILNIAEIDKTIDLAINQADISEELLSILEQNKPLLVDIDKLRTLLKQFRDNRNSSVNDIKFLEDRINYLVEQKNLSKTEPLRSDNLLQIAEDDAEAEKSFADEFSEDQLADIIGFSTEDLTDLREIIHEGRELSNDNQVVVTDKLKENIVKQIVESGDNYYMSQADNLNIMKKKPQKDYSSYTEKILNGFTDIYEQFMPYDYSGWNQQTDHLSRMDQGDDQFVLSLYK